MLLERQTDAEIFIFPQNVLFNWSTTLAERWKALILWIKNILMPLRILSEGSFIFLEIKPTEPITWNNMQIVLRHITPYTHAW